MDLIGKRLKKLRQHSGLSRNLIQRKYGISANTIKSWESGNGNMGIAKLFEYLEIFKYYGFVVSPEELVGIDVSGDSLDIRYLKNNRKAKTTEPDNPVIPSRTSVFNKMLSGKNIDTIVKRYLLQKELEFQTLFNNVPFAILYKDEKDIITKLNINAAAVLGTGKPTDYEGYNCSDIFPNQAESCLRSDYSVIKKNEPIRHKDVTLENCHTGWIRAYKISKFPYFNNKTGKTEILCIAAAKNSIL